MSRSLQRWPSGGSRLSGLRRSASLEVDQQSLDDSILQIPKLRLKRTIRRMSAQAHQQHKKTTTRLYPPPSSSTKEDVEGESRPPQSAVLDQLFDFIGSHPEAAVSPWRFLEAVNVRRERSVARHYALVYMKQLLMAGGAGVEVAIPPAHLVNSVASLLRAGPRLQAGSVADSQVWIRTFLKVMVSVLKTESDNFYRCTYIFSFLIKSSV
jgi:hypothetical protein